MLSTKSKNAPGFDVPVSVVPVEGLEVPVPGAEVPLPGVVVLEQGKMTHVGLAIVKTPP